MKKLSSQNKILSRISSTPTIDSSSWIIHVRSLFEEKEVEEDDRNNDVTSVCVYNVPKLLRALKPEAYSPQFVALGPYHHWCQDLYEMERYKLICAKNVQNEVKNNFKFEDLVNKLLKKDYEMRGCYHKYLDMEGEVLAWMMAIDGLFLLEFLSIYVKTHEESLASWARMSYLVNSMGKKLAYDAILKDVLMLENQIPIFVLKKILRVQCSSRELGENLLHLMMMGVCKEVSPLALNENYPLSDAVPCAHLLDLLYRLIVPKLELEEHGIQDMLGFMYEEENPSIGEYEEVLTNTWQMASTLTIMKKFTKFLDFKPLKLVAQLPFKSLKQVAQLPIKILSKQPIVSAMAPALESMFLGTNEEGSKREERNSSGKDEQVPLVEQIMVPSVEKLYNSGIQFCPTDGDITTIKFDCTARKFYLPVVHLDANTEVIMRNLVAYEASAVSGPLVLARYTELMNGITDTAKDAEILRCNKIIISSLKTDKELSSRNVEWTDESNPINKGSIH